MSSLPENICGSINWTVQRRGVARQCCGALLPEGLALVGMPPLDEAEWTQGPALQLQ